MEKLKATFDHDLPKHQVNAKVTAAYITFSCPHCRMKRVISRKTGKMKIIHHGDFDVLHEGFTVPFDVVGMS